MIIHPVKTILIPCYACIRVTLIPSRSLYHLLTSQTHSQTINRRIAFAITVAMQFKFLLITALAALVAAAPVPDNLFDDSLKNYEALVSNSGEFVMTSTVKHS